MPLIILLVDDEPLAREGLRDMLACDAEVAAIHEARNGQEAVRAIHELSPDLVFLDVQMPEMDGFAVLRKVGADKMPVVIFVTAHDKYAIQAFDIHAVDYLLKPVTGERFAKALERAKSSLKARQAGSRLDETNQQLLSLLETLAVPQRALKRLAVRSSGKTVFVEIEDIDWIEAAENYVRLHAGRTEHLIHVTMNALEKQIDPELFMRVHRSLIVNVSRIKELRPVTHGEYMITLSNGVRLQSGRVYSDRLKALTTNPFS